MNKKAVKFDATDLSLAYAGIKKYYHSNKNKTVNETNLKKLAGLLGIKNFQEMNLQFVLRNWSTLLFSREEEWRNNIRLKKAVKKIIELKADGPEEEDIAELQKANEFRHIIEIILKKYVS
jgi:hypothetical protein